MAKFPEQVAKHPTDCDETLKAVLDNVKMHNKADDKLVGYTIFPDKVVLEYEG